MNVKRVFGILLTLAGLIGLIYGGLDFTSGGIARASWVYVIFGGIFFFSGLSLLRGTNDVAK